ncbi:hypothetical protein EIO00_11565 [Thermomonospora catenispora]|nr:hypothetical protein EIO00_11565 [Thermomonospora catenispora]
MRPPRARLLRPARPLRRPRHARRPASRPRERSGAAQRPDPRASPSSIPGPPGGGVDGSRSCSAPRRPARRRPAHMGEATLTGPRTVRHF